MSRRTVLVFCLVIIGFLALPNALISTSSEESLSPEKKAALELAEKYKPLLTKIGSTVWECAELGLNEYKSSYFIADELEKLGFSVERGIAQFPTAFIGSFSYGTGTPVIGLLAEYDALPEVAGDGSGGQGHGCGHSLYGAGAFGTAAVLKELMETYKISGTVKVIGSPAEENFDGKAWMIKQDALDGIDVFFGCHSSSSNTIPYRSSNAIDYKIYTFHGKTAHAASVPHRGVSALDAVEIMNVAANYLREHVPMQARIHYVIDIGGEAPNVVPAIARSSYYIRSPEISLVKGLSEKIDNCAKGAALATGTTVDIELASSIHNKLMNRAGVDLAWKNLQIVGPPAFTEEDQEAAKALGFEKGLSTELKPPSEKLGQSYGSSDEGDVSYNAPLINFSMANVAQDTPGHTIEATKQANMPAAYTAATQNVKVMALTAIDIMTNQDDLKKIKDNFVEDMKERKYEPGPEKMLKLKYFPEPPGIYASLPNEITFIEEETFFKEKSGMVINVYSGEKKLGTLSLKGKEKTYMIKTTSRFQKEDILTVKYQNKGQPEVVYGYIKKYN